jgi:hypothetical protein
LEGLNTLTAAALNASKLIYLDLNKVLDDENSKQPRLCYNYLKIGLALSDFKSYRKIHFKE